MENNIELCKGISERCAYCKWYEWTAELLYKTGDGRKCNYPYADRHRESVLGE